MFILALILAVSSWAIPHDAYWREQLNRSFVAESAFPQFIEKYHPALKAAKHVRLQPLAHYKNVATKNLTAHQDMYRKYFSDFLRSFYAFIDAKLETSEHTAYFHKGTNQRLLVVIPAPHFGAPSDNSVLLSGLMKRFSDYNLLYIDNSAPLFIKEPTTLLQLQVQLQKTLKAAYQKWNLTKLKDKNLYVVCFATPIVTGAIADQPHLYDRVVIYSPMIKEKTPGHLMNPRRIYENETSFPIAHIMFSYANILNGDSIALPPYFMQRAGQANVATFANIFSAYEEGVPLTGIKNLYAILAAKDQIVPTENSAPERFLEVYTIADADHLDAVALDDKLALHLKALEKFISLPILQN